MSRYIIDLDEDDFIFGRNKVITTDVKGTDFVFDWELIQGNYMENDDTFEVSYFLNVN